MRFGKTSLKHLKGIILSWDTIEVGCVSGTLMTPLTVLMTPLILKDTSTGSCLLTPLILNDTSTGTCLLTPLILKDTSTGSCLLTPLILNDT